MYAIYISIQHTNSPTEHPSTGVADSEVAGEKPDLRPPKARGFIPCPLGGKVGFCGLELHVGTLFCLSSIYYLESLLSQSQVVSISISVNPCEKSFITQEAGATHTHTHIACLGK